MSYSCFSGNFSSHSLGSYLLQPGSSCGSSFPSNLIYCTNLCSPSTCQLGYSLYSGCQETCCEPTSCQMSCYRPRTSTLCSPCQMTYPWSLGFGSRSCHSLGCGSSGFRSLNYGICGFPCLSYRPRFCHPPYLASRTCQYSCYRPTCGSHFYQSTC
ncbi:PREDICTED: keratin-associated protein 13-1-like [Galeopterus variegatus]|uniref:Keratin-associated protein n=1 Tax=Galeopterus variegatus TaxID=482537 RepID=A0ABM0QYH5_GALVR|nr:PREDICTED: keratin-associated protein 13-1-like [Galeopterus variegatus]